MEPRFVAILMRKGYSHPQIDGKVHLTIKFSLGMTIFPFHLFGDYSSILISFSPNSHQISRDLLFHLFGDDYKLI